MDNKGLMINRAPVFTLWGAVVAERIGHSRQEALSLAKVMAGLAAQAKGRSLGIYRAPEPARAGTPPRKSGLGEDCWVRLCDRPVPAKMTPEGLRGTVKDQPVDPAKVQRYLEQKFGGYLLPAWRAMEALAASFPPGELETRAYGLYEKFRPEIPAGTVGWGAKGVLDLDLIARLARHGG